MLATLPDNEQEKVLAYAQGVSAGAAVAKSTSAEKVSAWVEPGEMVDNLIMIGGDKND